MIDFNFLRIKWPKLAAIAADASRLVEVSPSSAIGTMQNFCEWATDIALDFYDINLPNGIPQQEKLEALKTTAKVPQEIITRFTNVMEGGNARNYRMHENVMEARQLIEDVYEVARWLNKEADRSSGPSRNDSGRGMSRSPLGPSMGGGNGGFYSSNLGKAVQPYMPIILIAGAVLLVVGLGVGIAYAISNNGSKPVDKKTPPVISSTPLDATTETEATPSPDPTVPPEVSEYLDSLEPASKPASPSGYFAKVWTFKDKDSNFAIDTKEYRNGIGLFVAYKSIAKTTGTVSVKYQLDKKYSWLKFDLGADANIGHEKKNGSYQIRIYADDGTDPIYDSALNGYDFTDIGVEVNVSDVDVLKISLTEKKGTGKSTLNIVLGNAKLVKAGTGKSTSEESAIPTDSSTDSTESASPNPDDSSTADTSESASPDPDASASATADSSGE